MTPLMVKPAAFDSMDSYNPQGRFSSCGPVAVEMKVQDKQICIRFDNAVSLHLEGQEFQELEIYTGEEKCEITGCTSIHHPIGAALT